MGPLVHYNSVNGKFFFCLSINSPICNSFKRLVCEHRLGGVTVTRQKISFFAPDLPKDTISLIWERALTEISFSLASSYAYIIRNGGWGFASSGGWGFNVEFYGIWISDKTARGLATIRSSPAPSNKYKKNAWELHRTIKHVYKRN